MMKKLFSAISCMLLLIGLSACEEFTAITFPDILPEGFHESTPERPDYCRATMTYYGCADGESDLYMINLYTTAEKDANGKPTGSYEQLQIALFAPLSYETITDENGETVNVSKMSLDKLIGNYNEPDEMWGNNIFLPGMKMSVDSPIGYTDSPERTYYIKYTDGVAEATPDYLSEGSLKIERTSNGKFKISGMLVGTAFTKRFFDYEGDLEEVEDEDSDMANTSLEADFVLPNFAKGSVADFGDSYRLGDRSYRTFVVYLTDSNMTLTDAYPTGDGAMLALDIFVPWNTSAKDGVPAGEYNVISTNAYGGLNRDDIKPFNMIPGTPNRYTFYSGSWYRKNQGSILTDYARIDGGKMVVERVGNGYKIDFDLRDAKGHKITGTWESDQPLVAFDDIVGPDPDEPDDERPAVTDKDCILYQNDNFTETEPSPVRATFVESNGLTYLYLTPGDINYYADIYSTFYHCCIAFDPAQADGSVVRIENTNQTFSITAFDNYAMSSVSTSNGNLNGATGRYKVRKTSTDGDYYEVFIDVTFSNGDTLYASYSGIFKDAAEQAPANPNEFSYLGTKYAINSVILDARDASANHIYFTSASGISTLADMAKANPVCVTLPASEIGDIIGFSSCPTASISYNGVDWKASDKDATGTIETHLNGTNIEVSFTNWKDITGYYNGPVTIVK